MSDAEVLLPEENISRLLVTAEEGNPDFRILLNRGFGADVIRRFGRMPCTMYANMDGEVKRLGFGRLADVPGMEGSFRLAARIKEAGRDGSFMTRFGPDWERRINKSAILAMFGTEIVLCTSDDTLMVRNQISGFDRQRCSHLASHPLLPEIRRIAQEWGFDASRTVLD